MFYPNLDLCELACGKVSDEEFTVKAESLRGPVFPLVEEAFVEDEARVKHDIAQMLNLADALDKEKG